jgi:hypothetical protein
MADLDFDVAFLFSIVKVLCTYFLNVLAETKVNSGGISPTTKTPVLLPGFCVGMGMVS